MQNLGKVGTRILCLQELWLWDYEKHTLKYLFPDMEFHAMCYDTQNPISSTHVPRGKGEGVCILLPTGLGQYVKRLELSSHRIVAIQLTVPENIIIVNVYMPEICTDSKIEYQECINIHTNYLEKYPGYTYVLCGDFNATLSPPVIIYMTEYSKNLSKTLTYIIQPPLWTSPPLYITAIWESHILTTFWQINRIFFYQTPLQTQMRQKTPQLILQSTPNFM